VKRTLRLLKKGRGDEKERSWKGSRLGPPDFKKGGKKRVSGGGCREVGFLVGEGTGVPVVSRKK